MLRYNKQYQALADDFAKKHSEEEWIGAKYLGQYHEAWCDAPGPGWLTFEPFPRNNENRLTGKYYYILINEEELILFSTLYTLTNKTIRPWAGQIEHQQKISLPPKPDKNSPFIVAITSQLV